jgi:hypothetical protein
MYCWKLKPAAGLNAAAYDVARVRGSWDCAANVLLLLPPCGAGMVLQPELNPWQAGPRAVAEYLPLPLPWLV